jgi:hypothetical protein
MKKVLIALAAFLLTACASNSWTPGDTARSTDIIQAQKALVMLCQSDAGCTPGQVEVVEESTMCNLGSMMATHGADILDGGAEYGCKP